MFRYNNVTTTSDRDVPTQSVPNPSVPIPSVPILCVPNPGVPYLLKAILPRVQNPTKLRRKIKYWKTTTGAVQFWRQVMWFARNHRINLRGLLQFGKEQAKVRQGQVRKGSTNFNKTIILGLLSNRGSVRNFSDFLSIAMKTGNMEGIINLIRTRLEVEGIRGSVVPSIWNIKLSTAHMTSMFIAICKPEISYSGFRADLMSCVKLYAFLLLKKKDITDLHVDIWGDAANIGGLDETRMTFRLLCDAISAQSATAVFCVADYRGKDNRFALEQNLGPTVVGEQDSGWLYKQTLALHRAGVKLTYSGDSPFLLRLVLGNSNEISREYPSMLPMYVSNDGQHTFLPTTCHPVTGRRTCMDVPFREEVPNTSLVFMKDVR